MSLTSILLRGARLGKPECGLWGLNCHKTQLLCDATPQVVPHPVAIGSTKNLLLPEQVAGLWWARLVPRIPDLSLIFPDLQSSLFSFLIGWTRFIELFVWLSMLNVLFHRQQANFFPACRNSRVFENLADSKTDCIFKQTLDILKRERRYTMLMNLTSCDAIRKKLDEAKCILKDWEESQKENTDLEELGL